MYITTDTTSITVIFEVLFTRIWCQELSVDLAAQVKGQGLLFNFDQVQ